MDFITVRDLTKTLRTGLAAAGTAVIGTGVWAQTTLPDLPIIGAPVDGAMGFQPPATEIAAVCSGQAGLEACDYRLACRGGTIRWSEAGSSRSAQMSQVLPATFSWRRT